MGDLQHFCLRWNNYQSSITTAFENLRDDEDFVDVTLACEGKSLKAHRVVLSACSPYFRELLKSTPCKHPVIVLQDVVFEDLHALVEFIYHGEVNVHQQSLPSFLKTAEVLRVSGLTQQAEASAFGNATSGGAGEKWSSSRGGGGGGGVEGGEERGERSHHHRSQRGERDRDSREQREQRERERGERERERERERPASAGDASDHNQETHHTTKRAKSDPLAANNHRLSPERGDTKVGSNALQATGGADCEEPPVDFSTNNNNKHHHHHHHLLADLPSPLSELVKSEPMDLGCGGGNNGGGSAAGDCQQDGDSLDSGGAGGDVVSDTTTQDRDDGGGGGGGLMTSSPHASSYLDSKLFAAATGASFNFSMAAALAADSLAGLNNHSHVTGADLSLVPAGTSQGAVQQQLPLQCNECGCECETALQLRKHVQAAHSTPETTGGAAAYRTGSGTFETGSGAYRTGSGSTNRERTGNETSLELFRTGSAAVGQQRTGSATQGLHRSAAYRTGSGLHRTGSVPLGLQRTRSGQLAGGSKFRCDICGKVYSTMNSLRNHRSIYHRRNLAQSRQVMMQALMEQQQM